MFAARPQLKTLVDNNLVDVQEAPGVGKAIMVIALVVSNDQAVKTTVTISEGGDEAFVVALKANNDTVPIALPDGGWLLPEDTALKVQQSVNGTNAYVTAMTRVIPSQPLQD